MEIITDHLTNLNKLPHYHNWGKDEIWQYQKTKSKNIYE